MLCLSIHPGTLHFLFVQIQTDDLEWAVSDFGFQYQRSKHAVDFSETGLDHVLEIACGNAACCFLTEQKGGSERSESWQKKLHLLLS